MNSLPGRRVAVVGATGAGLPLQPSMDRSVCGTLGRQEDAADKPGAGIDPKLTTLMKVL